MSEDNVTAFEYNEDLKENCVLLGAKKAITTRFKTGVPIIPEEFWETIVIIPKGVPLNLIKVMFGLIKAYIKILEDCGFNCSDPVLEYAHGEPRIIYAIFPGDLSFHEKLIYLN